LKRAVRCQPSVLWHSASLLSELKLLSDLSDKSLSAGYMNASSVCWPLKANQSILASGRGRLHGRQLGASAQALQHFLFEGIQDGHVEVREITFVPSGHGEAMNARRGGHHSILT
jgi:hypothetical protein